MSDSAQTQLPAWLTQSQSYNPGNDRDSFITRSVLSMTGVLSSFRLDDGVSAKFSPSAPMKLVVALVLIVLNSLSHNFFFTLVLLAGVIARAALLPAKALKRLVAVAGTAAVVAFVIMIPAMVLGQSHSSVLIAVKTLVSAGLCMIVALSTPYNELTAGLRAFHVPGVFIMTIDLALKNIVSLGNVALEVLTSLRLRSVGRNTDKGASIGAVGGIVFLKSKEAADDTFAAMTCRGFDGTYTFGKKRLWKALDLAWLVLLAAIIALFVYTQGLL